MNNKAVTIIATFLLQAFLSIQVNGQDLASLTYDKLLPDFQQMTPEVASLGQYGNVGVSAYTGSPDIKIPLFNVTSGATSLPAFLYYDASGIKVTQEATFVGLGWNLSFGGCINHVVCGYDDFSNPENKSYAYFKQNIKPYMIYQQHRIQRGKIVTPYLNTTRIVYFIMPIQEDEFYLMKDIANGLHIPDIFQASFCGHNVSFVIDWETYKPIVVKSDGTQYKIECNIKSKNLYPESISITDDHGTTYQFTAFREFSNKDSFYLTKIYGSDGPEGNSAIDITYQQDYCTGGGRKYQSIAKMVSQNIYIPIDAQMAFASAINGKRTKDLSTYGTFNYDCYKVYPSAIVTRQQTVKFELGDRTDVKNARSIRRISVTAPDGTCTHDINFDYSYFEESKLNNTGTGKRLKLKNISIDGKKYSFQYNESESMPNSRSCSQDFWGYYNGIDNMDDFCSSPRYKQLDGNQYSCIEYLGEANRFASADKSKTWTLNRIVYPTGGYTDFEMEANRFVDCYYYPSAETEANKQYHTIYLSNLSVNAYETITSKTETFNLDKAQEVQIQVRLSTNNTNTDAAYVSIQSTKDNTYVVKVNTSDKYPHGDPSKTTQKILLEPGQYTITANAVSANKSPITNAYVNVSYSESVMEPNNDCLSIGGGLRVKSIKDYDSDGKFIGGKEYEYWGGKLLRPTPQIEHHYIDYKYDSSNNEDAISAKYNYDFVGSEPSHYYVCSLGAPANVGYTRVIEKNISKSGMITGSTAQEFWNTAYDLSTGINSRINRFYKNDPDQKNGRLIRQTILSPENSPMHSTEYTYSTKKGESVMYAMCEPTFIEHNEIRELTYDLSVLNIANSLNNLTIQKDSDYVAGKPSTYTTTSYSYNDNNNQPSIITMSNNISQIVTKKYYPSDMKTIGDSILEQKHCISEVTKIENYLDGNLIGGGRYAYTDCKGEPKVNQVFSIQRDGSEITELTVDKFDEMGNIRQYTSREGTPTTLLWSYNYQYPVMKLVGVKFDEIKNCPIGGIGTFMKFGSEGLNNITTLRNSMLSTLLNNNKYAQVTAYNFNPWFNISDIIEPNGKTSHYGYDEAGRLNLISDILGIQQKFEYNYRNPEK